MDFAVVNQNPIEGMYITSDAGNSWRKVPLNFDDKKYLGADIVNIDYSNKDNILIAMNYDHMYTEGNTTYFIPQGLIAKSTDGGKSFSTQLNPIIRGYNQIKMIDKNYGFITQYGDTAIKYTNDGGTTWSDIIISGTDNDHYLYSYSPKPGVFFIIRQTDFKGIRLIRSYDNGLTWETFNDYILSKMSSFKFIDKLNGWGIGSIDTTIGNVAKSINLITKTTNGGENWQIVYQDNIADKDGNYLSDFEFADSLNAIAVGRTNRVYKTTDGGLTWSMNKPYFLDSLNEWVTQVAYPNPNIAIAASYLGKIMRLTPEITSVPESLIISDNNDLKIFPNPTSQSTEIRYRITENCNVKLSLISLLGQEIAVLKDGFEEAGEHSYQLSVINYQLPEGVYFVRMVAGGMVETEKVLIIK